ncbi:Dual specificity mitogen-activated protein kinase kinase 2 [Oopsacas minuta]|uniref:mitogen-activated protein kinase kinase n=1 Tax=Oopsacas minuta TaxID=111878 RepID=A0AAV7KJA9_9METZ|nr:Dual specificity mitogen-activated protein kinase kinase 2 [Oopsacas minuta]
MTTDSTSNTPVLIHKQLQEGDRHDSVEKLDDCYTPKKSGNRPVHNFIINSLINLEEVLSNLPTETDLDSSQFSFKERNSLKDFIKKKKKIVKEYSKNSHNYLDLPHFESQCELAKFSSDETSRVLNAATGVWMINKKLKLESKQNRISTSLQDLDTLHRSTSPYLVGLYCYFLSNADNSYKHASHFTLDIYTEFMDIGSLRLILDTLCLRINEDALAYVTVCIIRGLKFLRDNGTAHKNLKPENILFNTYGAVKLSDYELVNFAQDKSTCKLTPRIYLPPERFSGGVTGSLGDVWSLGVILIEASTGLYPFSYSCSEDLNKAILLRVTGRGIPVPVIKRYSVILQNISTGSCPELPDATCSRTFKNFTSLCLMKNPSERYDVSKLLSHDYLQNKVNTMEQVYFEWIRSLAV